MTNSDRPAPVRLAAYMILASVAVIPIRIFADLAFIKSTGTFQFISIVLVTTMALILLLTYKIWQKRNWARIVFAILIAIGIIPSIFGMPDEFQRNAAVGAISVLQAFLQLSAVILLFFSESNQWFRKSKESTKQSAQEQL